MMVKILYDLQGADSLNKFVQSRIAPHLFIVCNYNPNAFTLIGDDAKFIQGIANLYKFTIDASLINKIRRIDDDLGGVIRRKYSSSLVELDKCLETISCLRTYSFHNNDHNDIIVKTESWLIKVIHKKQFEIIDDYSLALKELERLGDETYTIVLKILNDMVKEYPKSELCKAFQSYIMSFYKSNSRIIKEELRAAYKARSLSRGIIKDNALAMWCQKMYIGTREDKINFLAGYLPKLKGDQKKKVEASIEQIQVEIDGVRVQVAQESTRCKGDPSRLNSFDFLDFYCLSLENKCIAVLPEIIKQKMTMLPQDMVQFIILRDFESIIIDET